MAKDSLREYSAKRTFTATPEPPAAIAEGRGGPLLFVVQQHRASRLHYDFRLECDGVLKSWAVPKGPSLDTNEKRLAVQTEDHPFGYASFEGVIPPGQYGAGEVIVWDCGVYSPDEGATWYHDRAGAEREVLDGLAKGKLSFTLRGEKLKGSFALVKTKEAKQWLLIKHRDRFVTADDVTQQDRSVLSGIAVSEMKTVPAGKRLPAVQLVPNGEVVPMPAVAKLAPMLAESADKAFNKPDWMWEPKLDGYRVLAFIGEDGVRLRSRRGIDYAANFPALAAELGKQQAVNGMVLDGEIVAFDSNARPSFGALQERAQLKTASEIAAADRDMPVVFFAFDMPWFAGIDLRAVPYRERRRYLAQCILPSPRVQLVHAVDDGIALNEAAISAGFEGVIGKRKESRYESGKRSQSWLKVKPTQTGDFVIGGYTKGKGSRGELGALIVGYWEGKKLHFASGVGSGFDDRTLAAVLARIKPLERKTMPFAEKPELMNGGVPIWVEPTNVAEVEFQSWTDDGHLRAPIFLRLRDDLDAKKVKKPEFRSTPIKGSDHVIEPTIKWSDPFIGDVVKQLEEKKKDLVLVVGKDRIKVTNLDRVYWPEDKALKQPALTKRDLLRYFARVSPFILPHLRDRPLTMIRMPDGIRGQRFFQKHWEQEKPAFVEKIRVFSGSKDEQHDYLLCNNLPTLLWLAQSGTLEFHVWHSRSNPGLDAKMQASDFDSSLEALESSVLNFPDYVVFDLDPYIYSGQESKGAEPELNTVAFEKGKEVAFWLKELLNTMSLNPIVKTSGKTGLHIFVPIKRTIDFDAARHVSELVGRHLMKQHPKDITLEWSIPKRTGKIFMDYNMNVRGKTLNVAYSPRGEPGAPVSMPLTWEELANAHPLDFRLTNAMDRLVETGDRWHDALTIKQSLERALKK
ncbi:Multifunctional non-homologous end joining protein LigD [Usitatibacter rugosus]|uniref:DNA ligase (ATP) n=1 Tax=Usitatibacter rugosus TaxID=2732067 RepID=A0A6M4GYA6_9PROT|nr:DNA ligase D [Usitatibacter rugosus]QJR12005.1 Multifunctional non-homologous end joining protein LigD [Usitatibacter rugosus]